MTAGRTAIKILQLLVSTPPWNNEESINFQIPKLLVWLNTINISQAQVTHTQLIERFAIYLRL
jgi:hypothetical protein